MRSTQLAGEFQVTYGQLDIVWDGEELLQIIKREPTNEERYAKAIGLLQSSQAKDYFTRRTTRPTEKWPPDDKGSSAEEKGTTSDKSGNIDASSKTAKD
jgi:hypothetical protein